MGESFLSGGGGGLGKELFWPFHPFVMLNPIFSINNEYLLIKVSMAYVYIKPEVERTAKSTICSEQLHENRYLRWEGNET